MAPSHCTVLLLLALAAAVSAAKAPGPASLQIEIDNLTEEINLLQMDVTSLDSEVATLQKQAVRASSCHCTSVMRRQSCILIAHSLLSKPLCCAPQKQPGPTGASFHPLDESSRSKILHPPAPYSWHLSVFSACRRDRASRPDRSIGRGWTHRRSWPNGRTWGHWASGPSRSSWHPRRRCGCK